MPYSETKRNLTRVPGNQKSCAVLGLSACEADRRGARFSGGDVVPESVLGAEDAVVSSEPLPAQLRPRLHDTGGGGVCFSSTSLLPLGSVSPFPLSLPPTPPR